MYLRSSGVEPGYEPATPAVLKTVKQKASLFLTEQSSALGLCSLAPSAPYVFLPPFLTDVHLLQMCIKVEEAKTTYPGHTPAESQEPESKWRDNDILGYCVHPS